MSFIVVGTNYKYSPIELREKIYFSKRRIGDTLQFLKERTNFKAAVILSTCNRVEIYANVEDKEAGIKKIEDFIYRYHEVDNRAPSSYFYRYSGKEALKHLLLVCCGLDSLIVGEKQILEQIKFCFSESENNGFMDPFLKKIFQYVLSFSESIHKQTKISKQGISVGSIAIDFIKERMGSLNGKNILIVGTGKVTELVLERLNEEDSKVIFISSRNFRKAEEFADKIGAKAVKFENLKYLFDKANIIITATASPHFIIKKELLETVKGHRLLIIDLAVPRDVDPCVKEIDVVNLYSLEDLGSVIKRFEANKQVEIEKAKNIIDSQIEKIWTKLTVMEPEPALLP